MAMWRRAEFLRIVGDSASVRTLRPRAFAAAASNKGTFAGLKREAEFTTKINLDQPTDVLPVFRLIDEEGKIEGDLPFSLDEALAMYRTMVRVSTVDKIMNSLQRQGRISFYMTGTGEEAAQVGTVAALEADDMIWTQYRELGTFMHRGFTIQQAVDQCMGRGCDPGKGRQMPVHYVDAKLNLQAVTSPLATQFPQAAGAGYAFRTSGQDRCAVAYFGEGAASEGDAAVALNFAATLKSQTLFLCRNNGWAISTPSTDQYAGDGIAPRGLAFGMRTIRVDGNDLAAVYLATRRSRELCVENGEPVLVEMMTYRQGHHSTSDDATRYRGKDSAKEMAREGLEPISRMKIVLEREGKWSDAQEEELRTETRNEVMNALQVSEAKKFAPVTDMFEDVWANPTLQIKQQRQELLDHLKRHEGAYAESLKRFDPH